MEGSRPGVMLYFETLQAIEELEAEDVKQIMSAILHYSRDGEPPALQGTLAAVSPLPFVQSISNLPLCSLIANSAAIVDS